MATVASPLGPKAESVTKDGEPDGFQIQWGYSLQTESHGSTRLLVSAPSPRLREVHQAILRAVGGPWSVLYRQFVDRVHPRPQGAPPRDFLALERDPEVVLAALDECASLIYHDARFELWIRGRRGEQVILDADGVIYIYPDDPSFRDVCSQLGMEQRAVKTLQNCDYVKQWYHAENDPVEAGFIEGLQLNDMPSNDARRGLV